ncbi:hypothetical protein [Marinomonas sp. IMCC 4694]|nr:hypothetical protein [Marinomonas sp. IMCC 4694]
MDSSLMLNKVVTGNAALAHPCARGISASLHVIDVRNWQAPEENNDVA